MNKTSTVIVSTLGISLLASIGGIIWWWQANSADMIEATKTAYKDGQKMGETLDEPGCLSAIVNAHKAESSPGFINTTKRSITLRACLDTSELQPDFCEAVPISKTPFDASAWTIRTCTQQGVNDKYCGSMMQQVIQYCESPGREKKMRKLRKLQKKETTQKEAG